MTPRLEAEAGQRSELGADPEGIRARGQVTRKRRGPSRESISRKEISCHKVLSRTDGEREHRNPKEGGNRVTCSQKDKRHEDREQNGQSTRLPGDCGPQ